MLRVLYVDPNRTNQELFRRQLGATHLETALFTSSSASHAMRLAYEPTPFCLFSSRYFHDSDGIALCLCAAELLHCLGTVLLTTEPKAVPTSYYGVHVLAKPYSAAALTALLVKFMHRQESNYPATSQPPISATRRIVGRSDGRTEEDEPTLVSARFQPPKRETG